MGAIVGIVRDTNNIPLEDVNLVIVAGPSHPDIAAITDSYGMFGFDNLRPGNYILKAFGRVESDDIPVRLIRNKTPFVEIWLDNTSMSHGGDMVDEENYFRDENYFRENF